MSNRRKVHRAGGSTVPTTSAPVPVALLLATVAAETDLPLDEVTHWLGWLREHEFVSVADDGRVVCTMPS